MLNPTHSVQKMESGLSEQYVVWKKRNLDGTLDCALSYQEHYTHKLWQRLLIVQLPSKNSCVCYSFTEYCCSVWSANPIDAQATRLPQIVCTMHTIWGYLVVPANHSGQVPLLRILTVRSRVFDHSLSSFHGLHLDIGRGRRVTAVDNCTVERRLVLGSGPTTLL